MYNLLIVEDERIERIALQKIIYSNFNDINIVAECEDSDSAYDAIESNKIDFAFVDINIPGDDGISVSTAIRKKYPDAIIVITTAYDDFEYAHKAIKLKINDYLLKPVKPENIVDCIKSNIKKMGSNKSSEFEKSIEQLKKMIIVQDYRACTILINDIINDLYNEDINYDKKKVYIEIAKAIASVNSKANLDSNIKIKYHINWLENTDSIHSKKTDIINKLINILNVLFDDILRNAYFNNDIQLLVNYIERNIKSNITLDEVASFANITPFYLSKIFKKEKQINFKTYITERKIEIAKELLQDTDMPVMNIAMELSYNESNYFSKVFKNSVGITPTRYRNNQIKKA